MSTYEERMAEQEKIEKAIQFESDVRYDTIEFLSACLSTGQPLNNEIVDQCVELAVAVETKLDRYFDLRNMPEGNAQ